MKIINFITVLILLTTMACQENKSPVNLKKGALPKHVNQAQESSKFVNQFTSKAQDLISKNKHTSFQTLQSQKLDRIEENSNVIVSSASGAKMNGNEIYNYLKERTVIIGSSYYCNQCPNLHLTNATGFVIHEDGIILTNYHVIEVRKGLDVSAVFVSDNKGKVYPVEKILAASESNDLAIIQVDTKGEKLKANVFAEEEMMGEDVYMMGHPFGHSYFMSKGIIARKYISELDNETKIAITAEFGQGASGGPIVNELGQIVAMVSGTHMKYTNGSKQHGDLQLLIKEAIPVSVLRDYVK